MHDVYACIRYYVVFSFFMPPLNGGTFRFALVRPSIHLSVCPQLHKWGHPCPMDTFLVFHVILIFAILAIVTKITKVKTAKNLEN